MPEERRVTGQLKFGVPTCEILPYPDPQVIGAHDFLAHGLRGKVYGRTSRFSHKRLPHKAYDRLTTPNGRMSARIFTYGAPSSSTSARTSGRLQETPESYSNAKYVMRSAAICPGEELRPRMALAYDRVVVRKLGSQCAIADHGDHGVFEPSADSKRNVVLWRAYDSLNSLPRFSTGRLQGLRSNSDAPHGIEHSERHIWRCAEHRKLRHHRAITFADMLQRHCQAAHTAGPISAPKGILESTRLQKRDCQVRTRDASRVTAASGMQTECASGRKRDERGGGKEEMKGHTNEWGSDSECVRTHRRTNILRRLQSPSGIG
eukprot:7389399-Prymnesium_polylepis.2